MKAISARSASFTGRRETASTGTFRPQLTSLVDVMTILLVFLIKSFSVEGNLVTPAPDLVLPISSSSVPPQPRCAIEITRSMVIAEGRMVGSIDDISESDSLLIQELFTWMQLQKAKCTDSLRASEVLIQCDRDVEFRAVKKVMYTCSKAGFADFSVLVLEEDT